MKPLDSILNAIERGNAANVLPELRAPSPFARNTAAVTNCKRFSHKPPCQIDDQCHDCRSPERICRALLVLWMPMMDMECEVILIDESLGY